MNDLGNLLQMIYDLLSGWFNSFTSHALAVMEKLNLIETDTASIKNSASGIKSNTDDIKDNTGAIVTPVLSIKTNTDSIKTDTTTIKNNVSTMSNQLGTISTNVGTASAFTEDVANNTLDIKDRIVTIGSDTTQLRSNSNTITSDVSDIKTALNYYIANTPVTEDAEGSICNFDTDLTDYLQKAILTIPSDANGFSSVNVNKVGKNLLDTTKYYQGSANTLILGQNVGYATPLFYLRAGNYSIRVESSQLATVRYRLPDSTNVLIGNTSTDLHFTVITPTMCAFYLYTANGISISDISYFQLEIGNECTTYEPYKIMTNTVSFGSTITDGAEIDLLSGLMKVNTTPATYTQLTPIAIRTYKGVNNIYANVGDMSVTYRETLKHYLDKQEA